MLVYVYDLGNEEGAECLGWFPPSEIDGVVELVKKYWVITDSGECKFVSANLLTTEKEVEFWINVESA